MKAKAAFILTHAIRVRASKRALAFGLGPSTPDPAHDSGMSAHELHRSQPVQMIEGGLVCGQSVLQDLVLHLRVPFSLAEPLSHNHLAPPKARTAVAAMS
jgi:hypothetical protein